MQIQIEATYTAVAHAMVELPIESWDQIEWWYVKWNYLIYKIKGGPDTYEINLGDIDPERMDTKRPVTVDIRENQGNPLDSNP